MAAKVRGHWTAIALAVLMVLAVRASTPVARPMNDGFEYLKVASAGFRPEAQLGAPFVYRLAVPLLVRGIALVTGAEPVAIFPIVALIASVALLLSVFAIALAAGASRRQGFLLMFLLAASFFVIRFPLYCAYTVDVEAVFVSCVAFVFLLRARYVAALAASLVGLLFKEFLLAPIAVLIGMFLVQYFREKTVAPLRLAVISLALALVVFLLPRLLIPVTFSYGTFMRLKAAAPSQTMYLSEVRWLLAWPPQIGTPINVLLALVSFWLPALMLASGSRIRVLWESLGSARIPVVLWMLVDLLLMTVGGTNIMIFVTYTAPVLVLALVLLLRPGVERAELAVVLIGTVLFNRMVFPYGTPGGELDLEFNFYGAYWHKLTDATAWRFAEVGGWILLGWAIRRWGKRKETDASIQNQTHVAPFPRQIL